MLRCEFSTNRMGAQQQVLACRRSHRQCLRRPQPGYLVKGNQVFLFDWVVLRTNGREKCLITTSGKFILFPSVVYIIPNRGNIMNTCARCHDPFIDNRSFTVRLKDGSAAKICVNCATELQAKRSQKQPAAPAALEKGAPVPPPVPLATKAKSSGDRWYKTIGIGIVCIIFAGLIYYQLMRLEVGEISSFRVWWPVALLYNTLGFWGAISCPGILAVLFLGLGVKQLIDEENAKATE